MNAVMYLVLASPETTPMTHGKAAAQAAHAAVEAYRLTDPESNLHKNWYVAHHYTKIVLQADDLFLAQEYLQERGVKTKLIIDEGRTEFDGRLTPTALGCALVNKDNPHIQDTFSVFKLYTARPEVAVIECTGKISPDKLEEIKQYVKNGDLASAKLAVLPSPKEPKRPLRCRFGRHHSYGGQGRFKWCLDCGTTWERNSSYFPKKLPSYRYGEKR